MTVKQQLSKVNTEKEMRERVDIIARKKKQNKKIPQYLHQLFNGLVLPESRVLQVW